jgi:hypothetical protein
LYRLILKWKKVGGGDSFKGKKGGERRKKRDILMERT